MVRTMEKAVGRYVVGGDPRLKALEKFSRHSALAKSREDLCRSIVQTAAGAMESNSACLLVREEGYSFEAAVRHGVRMEAMPRLKMRSNHPLILWLRLNRDILWHRQLDVLPELRLISREDRQKLDNLDVELYCPLGTDELVGILMLGPKLREGGYLMEDMQFLAALARQASLEMEKVQLLGVQGTKGEQVKYLHADRGVFLNALAHELKNPLTSAISSSEMLTGLLDGQPEDVRLLVEDVRSSVRSLEKTVNDILEFGRAQRTALRFAVQPVDLQQLAITLQRETEHLLGKRQQKLVLNLPVESLRVQADPVRLKQVLYNLVSNASKFSPPGSEIVLRALTDDHSVHIEVEDCAEPIPAEERARLFDPYYRGRSAQGGHVPGLGLGLFVCKQLIELQQGRIWLADERPGGNIFCISLPKGG